jgi:hypothetical protein
MTHTVTETRTYADYTIVTEEPGARYTVRTHTANVPWLSDVDLVINTTVDSRDSALQLIKLTETRARLCHTVLNHCGQTGDGLAYVLTHCDIGDIAHQITEQFWR